MKKIIMIMVLAAFSTSANAGVVRFTSKKAYKGGKIVLKGGKKAVKTTGKILI